MEVRIEELRIENMTCGGCAGSVTRAIRSVDPDARVETNPAARAVRVETTAAPAAILARLEAAGYPAAANRSEARRSEAGRSEAGL